MYRFKTGAFEDKTIEQAILRDAPRLYRLAKWAEENAILPKMLRHFNRLRKKLERARIFERCREADCKKRARWMTLPLFYGGGWLPSPYYWCDKHGPHEVDGISPKLQIHFDAIKAFRDKWGEKEISKCIKLALGIKKGTRITEEFARRFFAALAP